MSLANFAETGGTFIGNAVLTVTGQLIISGGTVSGDPIDVVRNFSNPAAITLSSGQIYSTPALSNVTLLAIEQQYDLLDPSGNGSYFYNARGGEEKYLVSGNGSNPAGGGYYVLLPNGNLYAWTGNSLALSLAADPVASPGVAAYANPSLLISPPVAYNATVYDTEQSLALTGPALTTPQYEYFVSANGSNAGHGGGYILVANGNLYAWQGTFAASVSGPATVLGSVYYQNPTGLTDPTPPDNLNQVSAGISGGILTVADSTSGDNGFLGTALVAFSTASTSYNVDVTFSDTAPVWTGPGNQTVILPTTKQTSALSLNATDTAGNALTYTAQVAGYNPLFNAEQQYDLKIPPSGTYFFNARGGGEEYLVSGNGGNAANGGYYIIVPNGNLYAFTGTLASSETPANFAAALGTAAYADPGLLVHGVTSV